jgi:hypothetical protein
MTVRESISELLDGMPEPRQRLLLDFARFLTVEAEREGWQQFGMSHFAQAYSDNEPDYTIQDLKQGSRNAAG